MPDAQAESPRRGLALAIATWFGSGLLPIAPGTWGSAATFPVLLVLWHLPPGAYTLVTVGLVCAGVWAADEAERIYGQKDDRRIVIDEVAGQLLTWAPLLSLHGTGVTPRWWVGLAVTGFVVFRVLDVFKPPPARWAERTFPGGAGVVLDDVVAGVMGGVVMAGVVWVFLRIG